MNKVYIFVPILCLAGFSFIYWNAHSELVQRAENARKAAEDARQKKIADEVAAREKAYKDAIATAEKRKKEKAEREAQDQANRDARDALLNEREKMRLESDRLARLIERQTKDIEVEKEDLNKIEEQKRGYLAEQEFLRSYVKQAETNQKGLEDVLTKIAAADKAAADAAKAAATKKS